MNHQYSFVALLSLAVLSIVLSGCGSGGGHNAYSNQAPEFLSCEHSRAEARRAERKADRAESRADRPVNSGHSQNVGQAMANFGAALQNLGKRREQEAKMRRAYEYLVSNEC